MEDPFELNIFKYFTEAKEVNIVNPYGRFIKEWNKETKEKSINNLSNYLINNPDSNNPVIPEFNKLRKLRWDKEENEYNNNGVLRIINAYIHISNEILLLRCYNKGDREDLSWKEYKFLNFAVKSLEIERKKSK